MDQQLSQETIDQFIGAAHGDFDTVKSLLEQYPGLIKANASWKETAIQAAAQMGRTDIVQYLVEKGAPIDICTAAMLGNNDQVRAILQAEPAQLYARGAHFIPLLYYPVIMGNKGLADFLLAKGVDVNAGEGQTAPLHGAIQFHQPEMVDWLLTHGARVDVKNHEGKTALQMAEEAGDAQILEMLKAKS